jgi:vacuolar-type H+-ATPase subunit F/Vma7
MRRLWPLATLALLQACSNCGGAPTEAPSRYLAKTAEMAVEIPDLAALATRKAAIVAKLEGVATKEQVDLAVLELKRTLTFDPTTVEGLEAAGLPKKGAVAVEVIDSGRGALWVVPVGNKEKLQATLDELVKSRMRAEETKEEAVEGGKVKVHYGTFGPEKVVVGAHAFVSGFVLVGVGPKALDSVTQKVVDELESLAANKVTDPLRIAQAVRRTIGKWVGEVYRRQPMIVPTVLEI